MLGSELRIEVLESFTALVTSLSNLSAAIKQEDHLIAWIQEAPSLFPFPIGLSSREKAMMIFNQLEYLNHQAPREILICAGFIGATPPTLSLAHQVNACKDRFKQSILALKNARIMKSDPLITQAFETFLSRTSPTAYTLKKMGLARLHLKQCYRKIPILPHAPLKISWTWANTRSIKKITVKEAQERLHKKGKDLGIQSQLLKLSTLSAQESLAIVQDLAPHLRANILFTEQCEIQRMMIKGPIPIFFPALAQTPYPDFKAPTQKSGRNEHRSKRSDVKLDPHPFLPAIRAHRYVQDPLAEPCP